jgi:hypothetical protein
MDNFVICSSFAVADFCTTIKRISTVMVRKKKSGYFWSSFAIYPIFYLYYIILIKILRSIANQALVLRHCSLENIHSLIHHCVLIIYCLQIKCKYNYVSDK